MESQGCNIKAWIEAMRLRTLPVSMAPVLVGAALAAGNITWGAFVLCLCFALIAQVASNFANEYYDWRDGLDRPGREGFRRGVTEGDIAPGAMKRATVFTLGLACAVGLGLLYYAPWWLLLVGAFIALGALSYSAGPYPLSRHALGEVGVIIFFGVIPVLFTYLLVSGSINDLGWSDRLLTVLLASLAIGLISSNILIVNNYRDRDDDREAGKTTIAVKFGLRFASRLYLLNGFAAMALLYPVWTALGLRSCIIPLVYLQLHLLLWNSLRHHTGAALNPLLGKTALLLFALSLSIFVYSLLSI